MPKEYKPKGTLAREKVENAIQITVTITNGSTVPYEVIHAVPNVRDDKGMTASMVFDVAGPGGGVPRFIRGAIMPGESASGIVAFEVPEGTKSIRADISPESASTTSSTPAPWAETAQPSEASEAGNHTGSRTSRQKDD